VVNPLLTQRIAILSAVLLAGVVALHASVSGESLPPREPLADLPGAVGMWHSTGDVLIDEDSLKVLNADDFVSRAYSAGPRSAELLIAYYGSQRQGGTMHSPLNCLPASGWQPVVADTVQVATQAAPIIANRAVVQKGLDRQLVLYWYQSHGRTVASEFTSKAYLVLDSIRLHRSDASLIRIVTPFGDDGRAAMDFARTIQPALRRYIPD
jgi:EpsI family protein